MQGQPSNSATRSSSRATRPEIDVSKRLARHSRLKSSMMHRTRNRRPRARLSDTKSNDQRWFDPCRIGMVRGYRVPACDRHACVLSTVLPGRCGRASSSSLSRPSARAECAGGGSHTSCVFHGSPGSASPLQPVRRNANPHTPPLLSQPGKCTEELQFKNFGCPGINSSERRGTGELVIGYGSRTRSSPGDLSNLLSNQMEITRPKRGACAVRDAEFLTN